MPFVKWNKELNRIESSLRSRAGPEPIHLCFRIHAKPPLVFSRPDATAIITKSDFLPSFSLSLSLSHALEFFPPLFSILPPPTPTYCSGWWSHTGRCCLLGAHTHTHTHCLNSQHGASPERISYWCKKVWLQTLHHSSKAAPLIN